MDFLVLLFQGAAEGGVGASAVVEVESVRYAAGSDQGSGCDGDGGV